MASSTAARLRRCKPSATANNHPIAGFSPWKAPSPPSANQGQSALMEFRTVSWHGWCGGARSSWVAVAVGRAVAAFEPDLVRAMRFRPPNKELLVKVDAALWFGIELHHPAFDALRIELLIDRAVERIREIDPSAVATDLHHLRTAVESTVPGTRMLFGGDDPADPYLAGKLRVVGVGHVILLHVSRAPAGDVEEPVIQGEVDVGDKGRYRLEPLQHRRELLRICGFGGDFDDLLHGPLI